MQQKNKRGPQEPSRQAASYTAASRCAVHALAGENEAGEALTADAGWQHSRGSETSSHERKKRRVDDGTPVTLVQEDIRQPTGVSRALPEEDETKEPERSKRCECVHPVSKKGIGFLAASIFSLVLRHDQRDVMTSKQLGGCCTLCTNKAKTLATAKLLQNTAAVPSSLAFRDWQDLYLFMQRCPRIWWGARFIAEACDCLRHTLVCFANMAAPLADLELKLGQGDLLKAVHTNVGTKHFSSKSKLFVTATGGNADAMIYLRKGILLEWTGGQSHKRDTRQAKATHQKNPSERSEWMAQHLYRAYATCKPTLDFKRELQQFRAQYGTEAYEQERQAIKDMIPPPGCEIKTAEWENAKRLEKQRYYRDMAYFDAGCQQLSQLKTQVPESEVLSALHTVVSGEVSADFILADNASLRNHDVAECKHDTNVQTTSPGPLMGNFTGRQLQYLEEAQEQQITLELTNEYDDWYSCLPDDWYSGWLDEEIAIFTECFSSLT